MLLQPSRKATSRDEYVLCHTIRTTASVESLSVAHGRQIVVGHGDGSVRVYSASDYRTLKGVMGLGAEVSSIACVKRSGTHLGDVWLASGRRVYKFELDCDKMVLKLEDKVAEVEVKQNGASHGGDKDTNVGDDDDVLNEIAVAKTHLAFSMDSGLVGVVDLSNLSVSMMKSKHDSICGSVTSIPDRPRELVSAGYDQALLHFDFLQGTLLSRREIPPSSGSAGQTSLSPPFITSTAISSKGILAAGTADGRLWLGLGGRKPLKPSKKKRSRKWEGLKEDEEMILEAAQGPIVAMDFAESGALIISTMLGVVTRINLEFDETEETMVPEQFWQRKVECIEKVNCLTADDKRIVLGGLTKDGKGCIEIWEVNPVGASEKLDD